MKLYILGKTFKYNPWPVMFPYPSYVEFREKVNSTSVFLVEWNGINKKKYMLLLILALHLFSGQTRKCVGE